MKFVLGLTADDSLEMSQLIASAAAFFCPLISLSQGCLTLSFFERRASRSLFGLVSAEEKVV